MLDFSVEKMYLSIHFQGYRDANSRKDSASIVAVSDEPCDTCKAKRVFEEDLTMERAEQ